MVEDSFRRPIEMVPFIYLSVSLPYSHLYVFETKFNSSQVVMVINKLQPVIPAGGGFLNPADIEPPV